MIKEQPVTSDGRETSLSWRGRAGSWKVAFRLSSGGGAASADRGVTRRGRACRAEGPHCKDPQSKTFLRLVPIYNVTRAQP